MANYECSILKYINMKKYFQNLIFLALLTLVMYSCEKDDTKTWLNYTASDSELLEGISSIAIDNQSNTWLGGFNGITKFDGTNWIKYSSESTVYATIPHIINAIAVDNQDNKWFGSYYGGVLEIYGNTWKNYTTSNGLINDSINVIKVDSDNNKWFGTIGGISKFDGEKWTTYLEGVHVRSIAFDTKNNLWIGTWGSGVFMFDGTNWSNFTEIDGLVSNYIFSILIDNQGNKWIGTNDGLSKFEDNNFTSYFERILCFSFIEIDSEGNLWFATNSGVMKFDGTNWITYFDGVDIRALAVSEDEIWISKFTGGISVYKY
jgi:ligand-binding sensor domain-containing protein